MTPQVFTVIAPPKAVCSQSDQSGTQPWSKLVRNHLHVIRGGNDRAIDFIQNGKQVGLFRLVRRVQPVPAITSQGIASQLVVAGYAPDVGRNAVLFRQNRLRFQGFIEDRPAAKELYGGLLAFSSFEFVNALDDSFFAAGRDRRHCVVFVIEHDVVKTVFAFLVHAADSVLDDHGRLVNISRSIGGASGDGGRTHNAVSVLVLQAFTGQRGAAAGSTH